MEEQEIDTHIPQSEAIQFSWTVQGQLEESIAAANALSDGNGTRSF